MLQKHQFDSAKRSIRSTTGDKVAATVGGKEKGERKEYASKATALAALKRRYKQ